MTARAIRGRFSFPGALLQFEASVTHISNQGFGVVKGPDHATYFVRHTWRGDRGLFQTTDESDGAYRFAELLALKEASAERQTPPCAHLGTGADECQGCPWMMVNYPAQLAEKQHRVAYALERVGLRAQAIAPIWPSPREYQYRRRAQFKTDGQTLGYAGRQGLSIAPISHCPVLSPQLALQLEELRAQLPRVDWQPGKNHIWNYIDLDEDCVSNNVTLNRRRPFQQANADQNEAMQQWLRVHLQRHERTEAVLELFCGSGNFTAVACESGFSHITALEVGADAVTLLQQKNWPGVNAQRMDLYAPQAVRTVAALGPETRILIVNPPRDGIKHHWRLAALLPRLRTIYMISCDASSFAGDARRLVQQGFRLREVQPLDQMPHTAHLEILACFERQEA